MLCQSVATLSKSHNILFSEFQPNAGLTADFIFDTLPAGAVPLMVKIKPTIAFDSTDATMTASVVIKDGNGNSLNNPCDLLVVGNTDGIYAPVTAATSILDESAPSDLTASLTITTTVTSTLHLHQTSLNPPWVNGGVNIRDVATGTKTAHIVSVVSTGPTDWDVVLSSVVGDWSTLTGVGAIQQEGDGSNTATGSGYASGGTPGTINDLTAGAFDVWLWYVK